MRAFEWIFGRSLSPQEQLRKHQRALEKTQRELDRERVKLEQQEKKLKQEIKQCAKAGEYGAAKVKARDLVRTRRYISKFYGMKTQLQAVSLRIQTMRSNEQMMQSMRGATRLLAGMNRRMNVPALARIVQEFERQNDIMDQRQEMVDDAVDDVMEDEEDEGDEVLNQVIDELGVDLAQSLGMTPSHGMKNGQTESTQLLAQPLADSANGFNNNAPNGGISSPSDDDLQARLDKMKKSF